MELKVTANGTHSLTSQFPFHSPYRILRAVVVVTVWNVTFVKNEEETLRWWRRRRRDAALSTSSLSLSLSSVYYHLLSSISCIPPFTPLAIIIITTTDDNLPYQPHVFKGSHLRRRCLVIFPNTLWPIVVAGLTGFLSFILPPFFRVRASCERNLSKYTDSIYLD